MTPFTSSELAPAAAGLRPGLVRRLFTDTAYVLVGFAYAIASFVVLITGFATGAGLLVTVVGLPILTITLYAARGLATVERRALRAIVTVDAPSVRYREVPEDAGWFRRVLTPLTDVQYLLDFAHGLVTFVVSTFSFSVVVAWWGGAAGGVSYLLWGWAIPEDPDNVTLANLIGLPDGRFYDVLVEFVVGMVFLVTLPMVVRGTAMLRASVAKAMLFAPVGLRRQISELEAARDVAQAQTAAAVSAEATALRRLERDIHDGPQQRLVRLAMDLGRAQHQFDNDPQAARATVGEAITQTRETLAELRALSRGIAPPILTDRGLAAAVSALAGRSMIPIDVDAADLGRLEPALENAAYFVIAEALTNVAKHSGATECTISMRRTVTGMYVEIWDNGRGGAHLSKGHGLAGLADRVRAVGGTLAVDSPEGGPTTVIAELP
jgi:signal transduction histidine kinase